MRKHYPKRLVNRVLTVLLSLTMVLTYAPASQTDVRADNAASVAWGTTGYKDLELTNVTLTGVASDSDFHADKLTTEVKKGTQTTSDVTASIVTSSTAGAGYAAPEFSYSAKTLNFSVALTVSTSADMDASYTIRVYYDGDVIAQTVTARKADRTAPTVALSMNTVTVGSRTTPTLASSAVSKFSAAGTYTLGTDGNWSDGTHTVANSGISYSAGYAIPGDQIVYTPQTAATQGAYSVSGDTELVTALGTLNASEADAVFSNTAITLYNYIISGVMTCMVMELNGTGSYVMNARNTNITPPVYDATSYIQTMFSNGSSITLGSYYLKSVIITQTTAPVAAAAAKASYTASGSIPDNTVFTYNGSSWTGVSSGTTIVSGVTDLSRLGINVTYNLGTAPVSGDQITYNTSTATYTSAGQASAVSLYYNATDSRWHAGSASGTEATLADYGISVTGTPIDGDSIAFTPKSGATAAKAEYTVTTNRLSVTDTHTSESAVTAALTGTWTYDGTSFKTGENTLDTTALAAAGYTLTGILISGDQLVITQSSNGDTDLKTFAVTAAPNAPTASDFTFTAPTGLTYDTTAKAAMVTSSMTGMGTSITVYYSTNQATWSTTAPTAAGTYYVAIDVTAGTRYTAAAKITDSAWKFEIAKANQTLSFAETSVTKMAVKDVTYTQTVTGAGTTVAYSGDNSEVASVNSSTGAVTILKDGTVTITATAAADSNYNGATAAYTLTVTKDVTAPTLDIRIGTDSIKQVLNAITFNKFFQATQAVSVIAEDSDTGIDKTYYYVANEVLTEAEVKALTAWTEGTSVALDPTQKYVVYAKTTDKAGNVSYAGSDGMVIDSEAPVVSGIKSNKIYCSATEFTVADFDLDNVKIDGSEIAAVGGKYTLPADGTAHTITATDKSGNVTTLTDVKANDGHIYDKEVATADYLKSAGTCLAKAVYYKSCQCGEKGTETFEVGDFADHDFSGDWTIVKEATATEEGLKETACQYGCGTRKMEIIPATGVEDPSNGNLVKSVEVEENAPVSSAALDNSTEELLAASDIFDEADRTAIRKGTDARIYLQIKDVKETEISEADQKSIGDAVNEELGENSIIDYMDITLFKQVGDGEAVAIHEPGTEMEITIGILKDMLTDKNGLVRKYRIVKLHEGKVETITGTFNYLTNEFTFKTDEFSTYAIAYCDEKIGIEVTTPEGTTSISGIGNTMQLNVTVTPAGDANQTVSYESDNTKVATVDDTGLVTAVGEGKANITVTTADGSASQTITITVEADTEDSDADDADDTGDTDADDADDTGDTDADDADDTDDTDADDSDASDTEDDSDADDADDASDADDDSDADDNGVADDVTTDDDGDGTDMDSDDADATDDNSDADTDDLSDITDIESGDGFVWFWLFLAVLCLGYMGIAGTYGIKQARNRDKSVN